MFTRCYHQHRQTPDFPDDIFLIAHALQDLVEMLSAIHTVSQLVGLNMHLRKTKIMFSSHTKLSPVIVDGKTIEEVQLCAPWKEDLKEMVPYMQRAKEGLCLAGWFLEKFIAS